MEHFGGIATGSQTIHTTDELGAVTKRASLTCVTMSVKNTRKVCRHPIPLFKIHSLLIDTPEFPHVFRPNVIGTPVISE